MNHFNKNVAAAENSEVRTAVRLSDNDIDLTNLSPEAKQKLINVLMSRHKSNRAQLTMVTEAHAEDGVKYLDEVDDLMQFVSGVLGKGDLDEASKDKLLYLLQNSINKQNRIISNLIVGGDTDAAPRAEVKAKVTTKTTTKVAAKTVTPAKAKVKVKQQKTLMSKTEKKTPLENQSSSTIIKHKQPVSESEKTKSDDRALQLALHARRKNQERLAKKAVASSNKPVSPVQVPNKQPYLDLDEDDEEDEVDNETLFDLVDFYKDHKRIGRENSDLSSIVEVVKLRDSNVIDISHLYKGQKYKAEIDGKKTVIALNKDISSNFVYFIGDHMEGKVCDQPGEKSAGRKIVIEKGRSNKPIKFDIPSGADVHLKAGNDEYIVSALMQHESPDVEIEQADRRVYLKSIASSVFFHVFVLIMVAAFIVLPSKDEIEKEPTFVKIDMKDLQPKKEIKPPKPIEKPKPKPVAKAKPKVKPKPKTAPKKVAKTKPIPQPKAGGGAKGNIAKRNVKKTGLLAALGSKKGIKKGPKQALAQVSSLDAVTTSDNSASRLSVTGLTGKVKGARMTLPTGEIINTKGSTDILRSGGIDGKGTVGALQQGSTGNRQVAAMVSADMTKQVRVKGGMSREQVKKVIDAHMDEVVYCYEMALTNSPGLAGKTVFEWTIKTSGSVGVVNIKDSTVKSDEIHSCIKSAIKSWKFPKPKGSDVIVSYPFIFDMVGF